MTRVVSLFLPTWSTDRVRWKAGTTALPAETPLVLIGREANRWVVVAADAAAQAAGLRPGLPASKARVLVSGLVVRAADPDADTAALERLAVWTLQRFSPLVAIDDPDGIVIDSTGTAHLHGGEAPMLEALLGRLTLSGFAARAAVADTWGAAHALARYVARPTFITEPGHGMGVLASLPLEALRLPATSAAALRALGFERIGDLLAQPRAPLTLRFGPELGRRIDQALGRLAEPINPVQSLELIEARRAFIEPIGTAETIARCIAQLVVQLCAVLEAKGLGVRRLDLLCQLVDHRTQAVRVSLATPMRDVKRLTRLFCDRIETIEPGFGIEVMTLRATLTEPMGYRQVVSSLIEETSPDISDLVDILANRVGERAIYRIAPLSSDVPERAVRRIPAMAAPLASSMTADKSAIWPGHWPRPARLLTPPEPIETMALLPDHPPVSFTWRGMRRRVKRADGPERVFGEWWKRDAELIAVRDYFRVEDEAGARYWLYRSGDGEDEATGMQRWFLHGVFG